MSRRTLRFLKVYFRVLAISCSAQKRASQGLLSAYLALVLGDMLLQMWKYFDSGWQMNDFQLRRQQYLAFVKILDAMNVAYLLAHMVMVVQALLWRNQERILLSQLPPIGVGISLTSMRIHLAVDCTITGSALLLGVVNSIPANQMIANMRYLYSTQAVRARCLQVAILVLRVDSQLVTLQTQMSNGRRCNLELRSTYSHIVRLARKISDLYGLSVLLMNMLCIGDFIMVCYAYIVLWEITDSNLSWLLLWQGKSTICDWYSNFKRGRTSTEDSKRSGRPKEVIIPEIIRQVRQIVLTDRSVKVREIAETVGISTGSAVSILHDHLHMKKLNVKWVPHFLDIEQREKRVADSKSCLDMFNRNPSEFLRRYIMEETWIHHYIPESNRSSAEWREAGESRSKRVKASRWAALRSAE
ncbi:hypothetical protein ACLKA7_011629 [Drosophila subpalustris]